MSSYNFKQFLTSLTLEEIVTLFQNGVLKTPESVSMAWEMIQSKIIFENAVMNLDVFDQLSEQVRIYQQTESVKDNGTVTEPETEPNQAGTSMLRKNETKDETSHIQIISESEKHFRRFNATGTRIEFRIKPNHADENPFHFMKKVIDELVEIAVRNCDAHDFIGLTIENDNVPERPIGISFRKAHQLTPDIVTNMLTSVIQSNEQFLSSDLLRLVISKVKPPTGSGRITLTGVDSEDYSKIKKNSFILTPYADDNMCLGRALVLGVTFKENEHYTHSLLLDTDLLTRRASILCDSAGVDKNTPCGYEELQLFQNFLCNYTITVYNSRDGSSTYFKGPSGNDRTPLNLILENHHYNVIKSLTAAFNCSYYCEICKKRYNSNDRHLSCPYRCPCCHSSPPCNINQDLIECPTCHRTFRGPHCYQKHQNILCCKLQRCLNCFKSIWVTKKEKHQCGFEYCQICGERKPIRHDCFMSVVKDSKMKKKNEFVFIFYDLECTQDTGNAEEGFVHVPNLCVAQTVCNVCLEDSDMLKDCSFCGKRQHIFKDRPVYAFLQYVSSFRKHNVFAIAHNMRGYDGTFVLSEMMKNSVAWSPKIISNGTKIMSIKCGKIKFLDSLNFMPLPLSKLPATFGFEGVKGYFPFLFNTSEHSNYTGPLPDAKFYAPDQLSPSERKKFFCWYTSNVESGFVFEMQTEIVKYCISDVDILRQACLHFRKTFISSCNLDPFIESTTIAGACNLVFRKNFLKSNTIGIIPHGGYRFKDTQSVIAVKWLLYKEGEMNEKIEHTGRCREYRLPEGILVDGFIKTTKTVLQFNGCFYHGCEKCFPEQTIEFIDSKNKAEIPDNQSFLRREATESCENRIRALGYNLESIWECQFKEFLKLNPTIKVELDEKFSRFKTPLNARDAFFGGRTNAVKLHHKVNEEQGEKILYMDVCSLYPYVNKYKKYPVGHPKILIGQECANIDIEKVEGLVKCVVLPPKKLYHPVLPYRSHGKLMFPLCRTCMENLQQTDCEHDVVERAITGTYVADELRKACQMGYEILEIMEVWEYNVVQYDQRTKSMGLFSGYINKFLKLKQECSGWPENCSTLEAKENYITEYLEKEGIQLEFDKVKKNPGLRYLAKLMLNSFWGKFAQRENLTQTSIISNPEELFNKLYNPSINCKSIIFINDDHLLLIWDYIDEAVIPLKTVNVSIAAYTTAHARLVLYDYLEKLGRRVIYFDTDSVIFSAKPGEWVPETGDFLGMLTDELGKNSHIVEFVSGGPKNYAFKVCNTDTSEYSYICKVKGITLNYENSNIINFESMRAMVFGENDKLTVHTGRKICRKRNYQVISRSENKKYSVQFNKRRRIAIDDNFFDSLPYGYSD